MWWGWVFGGWGGWCDSSGGCGDCEGSEHCCSGGVRCWGGSGSGGSGSGGSSIQSSAFFGWAWSGSFSVVASLMVAVETVVTAVSVATVAAAAAAGASGESFLGRTSICAPTAYSSNSAGFCLPQPPNHHHLPVSADNGFRDCLKTLPS